MSEGHQEEQWTGGQHTGWKDQGSHQRARC